jgi:hypothetical protein
MESYVERYKRMAAAEPRREYISNEDFRRQKSALTRAANSGDPRKVLACVEKTLKEWEGKVWPDDWARWRCALEDAAWAADRAGDRELGSELYAASLVLFR